MKKERNRVMLGCWHIGGSVPRQPSKGNLYIKEGKFSGYYVPSFQDIHNESFSWRLPPLARNTPDGIDFMPFVLYDEVVVDKMAFDYLIGRLATPLGWSATKNSKKILEKLAEDGSIIFEDYVSQLKTQETSELVDNMVLADLSDPSIAVAAKASLHLWIQFYKDLFGVSEDDLRHFRDMIISLDSEKPGFYSLGVVYESVADINRVLVLSQLLETPLYDWEDYNQYYKYKFLRIGANKQTRPIGQTMKELFEIFIPNYHITDYQQLLDVRHDKRLNAVRTLALDIQDNPITKDLVIQAYEDILKAKNDEETFSKFTTVIGVLLNVFPGPIGDFFQITADSIHEKWCERDLKWQAFFIERARQFRKDEIRKTLNEIG